MKLELPLSEMSLAEKLEAVETIWAYLSQRAPEQTVPGWHAEILEEREPRLTADEEKIMAYEAKHRLRQEIHESQSP
jgi:hypothetical protein